MKQVTSIETYTLNELEERTGETRKDILRKACIKSIGIWFHLKKELIFLLGGPLILSGTFRVPKKYLTQFINKSIVPINYFFTKEGHEYRTDGLVEELIMNEIQTHSGEDLGLAPNQARSAIKLSIDNLCVLPADIYKFTNRDKMYNSDEIRTIRAYTDEKRRERMRREMAMLIPKNTTQNTQNDKNKESNGETLWKWEGIVNHVSKRLGRPIPLNTLKGWHDKTNARWLKKNTSGTVHANSSKVDNWLKKHKYI